MPRTNLELAKQYGLKVREYRNKANLSQEKLAEICDCSSQTIWGIEKGYNSPSFNLMDAISKALDVPIVYFFCNETDINLSAKEKEFMFNKMFSDLSIQDQDFVFRIITSLNNSKD